MVTIVFRPFNHLSCCLTSNKKRLFKGKYFGVKNRVFKRIFLFWLLISISLIAIPYPVYIQGYNNSYKSSLINNSPNRDIGIWTYGQALNEENIGEPDYIHDQTLEMLGKNDIYFVYGVNIEKLDSMLIKNILRCREHGIEVHISVNPLKLSYTNLWTFESLRNDIEDVLNYLECHNLTGNPITT
ncbi:MAG: hypothetical protein ACFFHV_11135, partial [Promethearchaeota archaeon]